MTRLFLTWFLLAAVAAACAPPPPAASPPPPAASPPSGPHGARDDAGEKACRACGGIWSVEGKAQVLQCNCPTHDAGKVCHDGAECEGHCLFETYEVVSKTPPMGMPVGKCSDHQVELGCFDIVERGASKKPPIPLPAPNPRICID